jgi:hypothetical protein
MSLESSKNADAPGQNKEYSIVINGRDFNWNEKKISYSQVLNLIGVTESNDIYYIVTYSKGVDEEPKGEITKTKEVKVKNGMIINAKPNNKS